MTCLHLTSYRSLVALVLGGGFFAPAAIHAQLDPTTGIVTGTNASSVSGPVTSTLGGLSFTNLGLVGVGRIDAGLTDAWGESLGSVSGLQVSGWTNNGGGSYSGSFNFTPDRGYNAGTTFSNYAARIQQVDFTFTPYTGAATSGVAQNQFTLTYDSVASQKLTYDAGGGNFVTTTGLIPDSGITLAGKTVPFVSVSNGTPTFPASGGTTINRVSLDTEGLVLKGDGSGYVSDEYGANIYHFNAAKQIDGVIAPVAAIVPRAAGGAVTFSSEVANVTGRRGNQGMEGMALSPDGTKLFGLMQSATVQELVAGAGQSGRIYTRLFVYDVSTNAVPGAPLAEYVLQLPKLDETGGNTPNRTGAQSEIVVVDNTHILVLSRDGNGKGLTTSNAPVFKSILLVDLANATDISKLNGGAYDLQGGDIASNGTTLDAGITRVSYVEALNILNTAQLGKFDLNINAGVNANVNSLSEKWEGMSLVPTGTPNEFFLFVANDNDFLSSATKMVGLDGTTINTIDAVSNAGLPVQNDTMFLAYRVSIAPVPEPGCALLLATGAAGFLGFRRRRSANS